MSENTCGWLVARRRQFPDPPANMTAEDYPFWHEEVAEAIAEDPWEIVECGAPVRDITDGWECDAGHHHYTYGSPSQIAEERQEAMMERGW